MRTMLRIAMDVEAANRAVKSGELKKVLQATLERLKPEAAYFTAIDGKRTAIVVFDLKDPSDMPSIAEPLFMTLGAQIFVSPVMNQEDLMKGLDKAEKMR
ncbi:MAG: hypothetical protein HYV09_04110 [Deltaproteobacteria bacterium]|nr:hypothetical protein [Deltaproteobacteria bacterium]